VHPGWENAFLATCVSLGLTQEEALRCLTDAGARRVESLARALSAKDRARRIAVLAAALGPIAIDLEKMKLL
jgi:hypothetical protein